jgi:hypothetical protein
VQKNEKEIVTAARELANCQYQAMSDRIMRKDVSHGDIKRRLKNATERLKTAIKKSNIQEKEAILLLSDEQLGVWASKATTEVMATGIKAPNRIC